MLPKQDGGLAEIIIARRHKRQRSQRRAVSDYAETLSK